MGREFALKNVRIWFKKDFECRYISHLDLNRCMLRALHKSKIPLWHTQGFNPHPFATFPLPLSLGFRGVNECVDIKLEDDDFEYDEIIKRLNSCLPRGLQVFKVTDIIMKAGTIAFADFTVNVSSDKKNSTAVAAELKDFLLLDSINVEKKSKKGLKTVDIKPFIKQYTITEKFDFVTLDIILAAGSTENVNPNLLIKALNDYYGTEYDADITRNNLYNSDLELFV